MGDQQPNDILEVLTLPAEVELVQHSTKNPFSPSGPGMKTDLEGAGALGAACHT